MVPATLRAGSRAILVSQWQPAAQAICSVDVKYLLPKTLCWHDRAGVAAMAATYGSYDICQLSAVWQPQLRRQLSIRDHSQIANPAAFAPLCW
jgi:hypothetical protein